MKGDVIFYENQKSIHCGDYPLDWCLRYRDYRNRIPYHKIFKRLSQQWLFLLYFQNEGNEKTCYFGIWKIPWVRNLGELFGKENDVLIVVGIIVGFLLGIAAILYILRKDTIGNLVIADDPEDGSYMFLEISRLDIERLRVQPTVKLNVVNKGKTHK